MNKERGILGKVAEVYRALKWYIEDPKKQYTPDEIKKYDFAAQFLTDRVGFAEFLTNRIGPNPGKIIEIAAGTGLISQSLSKRYPSSAVFTDISEPSFEFLKKRVGVAESFTVADFLNLPFKPKTFDTIVCVGGYRYVQDNNKELFWKMMNKVIKSQGRLFIGQFYPIGFPLKGSNIDKDLNVKFGTSPNFPFALKSTQTYQTKIKMPFGITSGKYVLFELVSRS